MVLAFAKRRLSIVVVVLIVTDVIDRRTWNASLPDDIRGTQKRFIDSPELLANFCLRELARRWGPAKVGRPASKPLRVEATSDPSSSFESFTDSLAPRVPGPSTFSAEFTTEPATATASLRLICGRLIIRIYVILGKNIRIRVYFFSRENVCACKNMNLTQK